MEMVRHAVRRAAPGPARWNWRGDQCPGNPRRRSRRLRGRLLAPGGRVSELGSLALDTLGVDCDSIAQVLERVGAGPHPAAPLTLAPALGRTFRFRCSRPAFRSFRLAKRTPLGRSCQRAVASRRGGDRRRERTLAGEAHTKLRARELYRPDRETESAGHRRQRRPGANRICHLPPGLSLLATRSGAGRFLQGIIHARKNTSEKVDVKLI